MRAKIEPTELRRRFTVNVERATRIFVPRTGQYLDRDGRPMADAQKESIDDRT
ncbi:hypothetical protein EV216_10823 [Rhodovulum steppense]|uniref:Uncharacterized protein n=1 Tax=Rhodovulum steppense TaxID=540251 RepID=A0A4R1YVK7_9RHOB|nr:hypothetical protein EV216_10823 [Rhodovulum steppense]